MEKPLANMVNELEVTMLEVDKMLTKHRMFHGHISKALRRLKKL